MILGAGLPGAASTIYMSKTVYMPKTIFIKGVKVSLQDKVKLIKEKCCGKIVDFFILNNKLVKIIIESDKKDTFCFETKQYGKDFTLVQKPKKLGKPLKSKWGVLIGKI